MCGANHAPEYRGCIGEFDPKKALEKVVKLLETPAESPYGGSPGVYAMSAALLVTFLLDTEFC